MIVDASIRISFFVKCLPKDVYRWPYKHGFKKASNAFCDLCAVSYKLLLHLITLWFKF
jgi:hypothetical protein